ncbi:MAG: DNA polymerase III, subunit gamma and tau [Candidatus Harrisonbacteria bacterium RIFCSPLOWO2_02_FULL_45_10c]|uniref:DNA polymerase III subunit gamma/tau n=1 Tax=Candidatus Harrisonbacteria bacterium RIFCSPLOWO2_02_FULL_45_10c TaxID=1798410 RepID=A0A1G1ZRA7_9BACT|nr:MAG: DNA polymerase III, subunit gamma and tau [Candidatus Harrisonbacteria bacterium RIFCSPLOWO2_02_FULL_45_10c]
MYRKYRPKTFDDLLGQEHIVEILRNAARQDKFAHAYLFYGPRGSGKTTTARLLAKLINCEKRQTDKSFKQKGESCNACDACVAIDAGQALDIIEIDAATNTGVEEIRDLQEGIRLSPTSFKYKVFIIDEMHMLSKSAFNALLKTLEEPPAHAFFILATTEYEKVPATILSRTQRFHFKKLALAEIIKKLGLIIKSEKLKVSAEALELIAALAEGSLRDAESLLDQITSLDQDVELKDVEKIAGKIGYKKTAALAEFLLSGKLEDSLQYLHEIEQDGYNLVQLNKDLIHYLRRVLTLKMNPNLENLYSKELTKDEVAHLKKHGALLQEQKHIQLLKSLIRAYSEMRYSPFAIVPLEIAIIENLSQP